MTVKRITIRAMEPRETAMAMMAPLLNLPIVLVVLELVLAETVPVAVEPRVSIDVMTVTPPG